MSLAAQAIITNGLSCGTSTACQSGTMLTAGPFSLFCVIAEPEPVIAGTNVGGGGHAANGWIGQPTYNQPVVLPQPDNQEETVVIDPSKFLGNKAPVTLKFKMGSFEKETIYLVDMNKRTVIVTIINLANVTKSKITARITGLTKIFTGVSVRIKNLRFYKGKTPRP